MRTRRDEEQIRELIRETLQQEGLLDDIKTGVGKAYDYVASLIGVKEPTKPGILKALDDLAPDAPQTSGSIIGSGLGSYSAALRDALLGVMATPGKINALIIGDSQAGGPLGAEIARDLEALGYGTKITAEAGSSGASIATKISQDAKGFDLVVAIFGGNDSSESVAVNALEAMYKACQEAGAHLIAVGPPPATKITDIGMARTVFGDNVKGANSHLTRDGGDYAERRIAIAQAIDSAARGRDGLSSFGIASRIPADQYPEQPDGIHCREGADAIADQILNAVGINDITVRLKSRISDVEREYSAASQQDYGGFFAGGSTPVTDRVSQSSRIDLRNDQLEMMRVIEQVLQSEGFKQAGIAAAFANAWQESRFDPKAEGDSGHSIGLFQLHDEGVGKGMSVEERQDPIINTRAIASAAKNSSFMQYMRETDDPQILAAAFSKYVERPRDKLGNMRDRAETVRDMLGLEDVESPGVMSV